MVMQELEPGQITQRLSAWRGSEQAALNRLVETLYPQLRLVAHRSMRMLAGMHTLQTTGLLHEAFLKLAQSSGVTLHDRAHFLALCALVIRRILVDEAQAHVSRKRGGAAARAEFNENHAAGLEPADVVPLHDALAALVKERPVEERRQSAGNPTRNSLARLALGPYVAEERDGWDGAR